MNMTSNNNNNIDKSYQKIQRKLKTLEGDREDDNNKNNVERSAITIR